MEKEKQVAFRATSGSAIIVLETHNGFFKVISRHVPESPHGDFLFGTYPDKEKAIEEFEKLLAI